MGLSASIVLIAVGAVLRFAVTTTITGLKIHVVGVILMGVGVFGLVLWFALWASSTLEARRSYRVRRSYESRQVSSLSRDLPDPHQNRDMPDTRVTEEDEEETRRIA